MSKNLSQTARWIVASIALFAAAVPVAAQAGGKTKTYTMKGSTFHPRDSKAHVSFRVESKKGKPKKIKNFTFKQVKTDCGRTNGKVKNVSLTRVQLSDGKTGYSFSADGKGDRHHAHFNFGGTLFRGGKKATGAITVKSNPDKPGANCGTAFYNAKKEG